MAGPQLRRAQTAAEATAAPPRLCRTWSVPRPSRRTAPGLCLELPWGQVSALPCFHALRGQVEVVAEVLPQLLSKEEVAQVQFRCHRAKFAAPLLGFALREGADGGTMLFYARPDGGFVADLEHLAWRQRLLLAHGAAAALWNLHALGFGCRVAPERLGISEGRAALLVGLEPARQEDVEQLGHLLVFLLTQGTAAAARTASRELLAALARNEGDDILEGLPWPRDEAQLLAHLAGVCFRQGPLQRVVTLLAERLRSEAAAPAPGALALRKPRWALLRHVLRACWAFQQGLDALCCVCLERQRKSLGLMCPTNHTYRLLCGSCLEPYVCSLIGTAELRRNKGGVACPACSASKGAQVFSKDQVQDRLVGQALRRFVEATKEEEEDDLEDDEAELSVLVEDLTTRRVRVVTHCRTFESEEPQVLRRSKQVLPYTWLRCQNEEEFFQYDPATMGLRQHMSSRLFCLQVAELVTLRCPSCGAFLDPDPDGCVAMTCLACNEGFCWVCFRACGQDAHPHALEVHGTYFPCPAFITAWHRKLRWQSVQEVLRQLMEDSQASALAESRPLLNDVQLWPFPAEAPEAPLAAPDWDGEEVEGAAPRQLHLHEAARFGQMERLQELLEQNVEVNERNERGMTPLCFAVHEGRSEAIRLLLARAADPNMADDHGVTPLHYACREPPFPILEDIPGLLLGYPEVEANRQDHTGSSAIVVAAEVGRAEVVPALLRCERLDPNLTNHQSRTALLVAAAFDHTEVVAHLLASPRVEVTRRSVEGETPLHLAAKRGAKGTTQLLLQHPGTES
ncbi:unnamed protein product [Effrenium voratum]|uniref:Uncharacterized protein n=1 Tax=Effrenium voratum TaxID=2562239 RepID=A0AA36J942_9DINO|nr:unnamed protein product [Effrenium voratum]